MDSSPLHPDSSVHAVGAWRLHEQVATGGSSSIWRATGPGDEVVAVKLLDAAASGTPAERRRFLRGFKVASILAHPGIARLIEAGEHAGRLFVVEEFIDGETLAERMRGGSLAVEEALRILRKCGEILRYAHEAGVVHRDLSPRNLMIDRAGRVVLVDFGIAVRPEGTTQPGTGSLIGTLPYLAPELIRGRPATARSDLYALGAISYQMLAGSPPFVATQPEAMIRHHLRTRPASLRKARPEIDPRLDRVVLRLLAKAPEDRFSNAEAFLGALDEAGRPRRGDRAGAPGPRRRAAREAGTIRRLAIAPFTADFDDGSDFERVGRIALGLAETVAAGLSGVEGLTVIPPARVHGVDLVEALNVDAVLSANLVEREGARRLSWTLVGRDGSVLEGGLLGGQSESFFALEDALLSELIRSLRRPRSAGRLQASAPLEGWYAPFLEALGCLQRADSESSIDRAIGLLERIRDDGAGGAQVHAALGRAYLRRSEILRDSEWRQRAEVSCRIAISLDPLATEAVVTMGRLLVSSGRPEEGTSTLERALDLEPENMDAKVWLSRAKEMTGHFDEADRIAHAACASHPEQWVVHDRRAVLDFRRGRFHEAATGWKRVLELTPDNSAARGNLGAAYFEQGALREAEEAYRAAVRTAPGANALSGLATVLFYEGRIEEAIHCFGQAVSAAPKDSRHWGNLADAQRWADGQRGRSLESFDRAIALVRNDIVGNSMDARSWSKLALYLAKREQHAEALVALRRALQLDGESSQGRMRAIIVHELAGRRSEALAMLRKLREHAAIPFELAEDPELQDLRRSPEAIELFRPPDELADPHPQTRRQPTCSTVFPSS